MTLSMLKEKMKSNSRRAYIILSLLLLIVVSIILYKTTSVTAMLHFKSEAIIEESMTDVQAWRFDKEGRLIQAVKMQSWLHYKDQTTSQMILPTLKMYHLDGSLWDISAQTGESFQTQIQGKLEKLQLSDNVTILRSTQENQDTWELKTQHLLFLTQNPTAITNDPVVVNGPGMKIHATGLRANLENNTLEFLKDVRTHYATPQA